MGQDVFLPEEMLIIGTAVKLNKKIVTLDEIKKYVNKCPFKVEYCDIPYKYSVFNEKDKTYTVSVPQLSMYILRILTSF